MATSQKENQSLEPTDIRETFRQVAPYIIRQWKEVCRKLGLQELEMAQLEVQEHMQSKAYLAFKGLCLWHEHVGKAATKDRLVYALRQCGLHRAEEEIERQELGKITNNGPSLMRPSSRQYSASRRPGTGNREHNGFISRPPSRTGSGTNSKRVPSSKGQKQQQCLKRGIVACELSLKVTVSKIDPGKEVSGIWREAFIEMTEHFYDAILVDPIIHMRGIEDGINLPEVSVIDIRKGSLLVRFRILTLGALESLNQMYKTRRLFAICQNVFVSENALKTIGAKHIKIKLELTSEQLDECRMFFLSRKFKDCVHPTDTLSPPSLSSQPSLEVSPADEIGCKDIFSDKWRDKICEEIQRVQERYSNFDDEMENFARTLTIILPQDKTQIDSLADLLNLYSYLSHTCSVASGVRLDLFREYLMIVNSLRLTVKEIQGNLQTRSQNEADDEDDLRIVQCLVDDLQVMLEPETNFDEDLSVLNRKISPSEKPFTNLICFIPLLLAKLSTLLSTLTPSLHEPLSE